MLSVNENARNRYLHKLNGLSVCDSRVGPVGRVSADVFETIR